MTEVTIKAHTRRGKGGKTVQVRSYSRRVGKKGVHSPKRDKRTEQPGEEFEKVSSEKKEATKLTPEEIAERREVMEGFKRAEAEMKSLGMTREQYSHYKFEQQKRGNTLSSHTEAVKNPLSPKGSLGILERVEDKIAKFVEKYGKRKYKRQL